MTRPKRPPVVLLVVAGVLVLGIGFGLWRYSRFNDLNVVSGLSVPVEVKLDGSSTFLGANARGRIERVSVGTHVIETFTKDGTLIDSLLVFIKGGSHELVYNVAGSAPVVWERIEYSRYSNNRPPQFSVYCGTRFIELDSVDHVFKEPPKSISTKSGSVYRTHLTVDEGGLKSCQSWALDKGTQAMWSMWQQLEARLDPKQALYAIDELARQGDYREAHAVLEQTLAKDPAADLQRVRMSLMLAAGQNALAQKTYARTADDPAAKDLDLYLAARLLSPTERLPFLEAALRRYPESPWLSWLYGRTLDRSGNSAGATAAYAIAANTDNPVAGYAVLGEVTALLHLRRYKEAFSIGEAYLRDPQQVDSAVSLANLATVTSSPRPDVSAKLKPYQLRWVQALLGEAVVELPKTSKEKDPEAFRQARELIRLAFSQPQAALTHAARANDTELRLLPANIVWLLLTEAWRAGDTNAARRLERSAQGYDAPRFELARTFIATEVMDPQVEGCADTYLSVLWFARARRLQMLGQSSKDAFEKARRFDVWRGVTTRALELWPGAQPSSARLAWVPVD